ncbi:hypothetical protein MRB53_026920 [Persea americana]|uniref:Uncharacterized protein n=1 Tax=Persea americana TaxID=3435 RepID=A0ACC2LKK9_PERAE|nr:hypothetical protein MRB53_026920 [Persea americana]
MQLVGLIYIMQPLHDEAERTKTEATTSANSSLLGGPDVYRAEMGNIREYTYPDVNLGDDTYKHFLYPTNDVASETNASPEDYNDDIDFNADLDDVLNQDESDSDHNSAGTSHDSVRCVIDLSYQQEVLECNKHQSNTMQKYNIEDTLVAVEDEGEDFIHIVYDLRSIIPHVMFDILTDLQLEGVGQPPSRSRDETKVVWKRTWVGY